MPQISKQKKDKISEQILHYLFEIFPQSQFTSKISESIARDEEFVKSLLTDLKNKELIVEVNKNSKGMQYSKRQRWRLSTQAHEAYARRQNQSNTPKTDAHNNNLYIEEDLE